jgi:hypothetical protein
MKLIKKNVTLQGIVTANEWDEEGQVIGLMIRAPEEKDYIVQPTDRARSLWKEINKKVTVVGEILLDNMGNNVIKVVAFQNRERG